MATMNNKSNASGHTKIVIITSDEDIANRIINNAQQTSSNTYVFNDLDFLNHLVNPSNDGDEMYRQVLNSPTVVLPDKHKVKKKPGQVCVVCGGHAIAYNYGALTCGSCKIFFRRHASGSIEQKRCLGGDGKCLINDDVRRKCIRCRLQRCYSVGMNTTFFLSDEEKKRRMERRNDNLPIANTDQPTHREPASSSISPVIDVGLSDTADEIDQCLMDLDNDTVVGEDRENEFHTLSNEDYARIQSLQSSFLLAFSNTSVFNQQPSSHTTDTHNRHATIAAWTEMESHNFTKLIVFFRQVDEFEALDSDDRFTLIKYNILSLFMVRKCLIFDPVHDTCLDTPTEDLDKRSSLLAVLPGSDRMKDQFMRWMHSMSQVTQQDSILVQLLLVILLFSEGLSMTEDELVSVNSIAIYRAQARYTCLLWNYLVSKQGYEQAAVQFSQVFNQILRLQTMTKFFRSFLKSQLVEPDTVEHIAPLMQTVLHISTAT